MSAVTEVVSACGSGEHSSKEAIERGDGNRKRKGNEVLR